MHKVPNLYRNRFGTYYLRVKVAGQEVKRSLGTKDTHNAKAAALAFALARHKPQGPSSVTPCNQEPLGLPSSMPTSGLHQTLEQGVNLQSLMQSASHHKFDLVMPSGVQFKNIQSPQEADLALAMYKAMTVPQVVLEKNQAPLVQVVGTVQEATQVMKSLATETAKTSPISKVVELYLKEMQFENGEKTRSDKKSTYAEFQLMFGDSDINSIKGQEATLFKQRILSKGTTVIRSNTKISHMKELFSWAIDNHQYFAGTNPFEKLRIGSKRGNKKTQVSYKAFSKEELEAIFDAKNYEFLDKADYYWLPWLALHSGARIEELASLPLDAIQEEAGIHYFQIEKGKTENSIRKVPLHDNVIKSGFLDYVSKIKNAGHSMLFPHLISGKNGYSKNASRRFGQYLVKLGIKAKGKSFHSFRATFITRMSAKGAHPAMLMALVGHYNQANVDLSSPHFDNYQDAKLIKELKTTMDLFLSPVNSIPQSSYSIPAPKKKLVRKA